MKAESLIYENEKLETYVHRSKESSNWKKAVENEIISLKKNETWELVIYHNVLKLCLVSGFI